MFKIGTGYDIHRLEQEDSSTTIRLGGIDIPSTKSVVAHSDGDVVIHAIIDALLGAVALGDIGQHFPDTDPQYQDASSIDLLKTTIQMVHQAGYKIGNVDATIIAQKPKLSPFILRMRESLALHLGGDITQVSVKATTNENVDATGQEQAIAVHAVALLAPL